MRASGFSHSTILPALAAAIAISMCRSFGTQMSIASMSARSTSFRQSVSTTRSPSAGERLGLVAAARRDRLQHGLVFESKKLPTLR